MRWTVLGGEEGGVIGYVVFFERGGWNGVGQVNAG